MLVSLAWGVLFLTGTLRVWHAAALLMLHGMAGVIASPPIQLIVYDIVGAEHLASAIRLNAISRYFSMLVGPAVGGALMLVVNPGVALLVNVLLYLPLTLYLFWMPYTGHRSERDKTRRTPRLGLAEARRVLADVRAAIVCAAIWGIVMGLFPLVHGYAAAVTFLVLAGIVNIAFTSMAQALVQILAPPGLRGRVVGLFNTSMLGLRAGSGVTVGVLGAVIGIEWSLALSAAAVVAVAVGLLIADVRARPAH